MTDKDYRIELNKRRAFFHDNFPLNIGRTRGDVNSYEVLKNSCPVCGYLTLQERNTFDICGICFWEDDGEDDFEADEESGPNNMTLIEGRATFFQAKEQLNTSAFGEADFKKRIQDDMRQLDLLIANEDAGTMEEIRKLQDQIMNLLQEHKIYGLENLFTKTDN